MAERSDDTAKLFDLVKAIRIGVLTTVDQSGELHGRPMYNQEIDEDGKLWFFTSIDSAKTDEVQTKHKVSIAFSDPQKNRYAILAGDGTVTRDRADIDRLWNDMAKAWFPKGKDDPNLALLCIRAERGEYWDGPSSTIYRLYGYAKSQLTGEPPTELGENEKVRLA